MIQTRFEDDLVGEPENFNDDLPLQLSDLIETSLFDKLIDATNF